MRIPSSVFGAAFMAAIREAIRKEIRHHRQWPTREAAADSGGIGGQSILEAKASRPMGVSSKDARSWGRSGLVFQD